MYDPTNFGFQSLQALQGQAAEWQPGLTGEGSDPYKSTGALSTAANATNFGIMMIGNVRTEGGLTKTLDTTGSSAIILRHGTVTWANGASTAKVGVATVDASNGPPARGTNVATVITASVSKSLVGGAGITANAYNSYVPDAGSLSVADKDLLCVFFQITNRAGADSVQVSNGNINVAAARPTVSQVNGAGTFSTLNGIPYCVLVFSDGTRGFIQGGTPAIIQTNVTQGSGSTPLQFGNYMKFPFAISVGGMAIASNGAFAGSCDFEIWSDPLGSAPALLATKSVNFKQLGNTGNRVHVLFDTPQEFKANVPFAIILKPTDASGTNHNYYTANNVNDWKQLAGGVDCYAVTRNSGVTTAFSQQNSGLDRYMMHPLIIKASKGAFGGTL